MTRDCGQSTGERPETVDRVQEMTRDCRQSTGDDSDCGQSTGDD
ncbi:unnamed protein product [Staurois parvus]|uniref:Uncharacterized protein n=1 Tax=Staurois parvus TaxID=386267 RepID=A0ABN9AYH6_9NEOB|nr:unnamed protein product [Staurois parvus]